MKAQKECCEVAAMFQRVCLDCNPQPKARARRVKNLCAKTRPQSDPYEVWEDAAAGWKWLVLKKWQANDDAPYARWFCAVSSPMTHGGVDLGDCYVSEVKRHARRTK